MTKRIDLLEDPVRTAQSTLYLGDETQSFRAEQDEDAVQRCLQTYLTHKYNLLVERGIFLR
jgi:hypothetical protein